MNIRLLRCDHMGGRLLIYAAVWLLAIMAFEAFLQPEGLTETNLSGIQQRIYWPPETPLMAVLGLAQSFTWPAFPTDTAFLSSVTCFVLIGLFIPFCTHRTMFVVLVCFHILMLAVAIFFFVRQSRLPPGP